MEMMKLSKIHHSIILLRKRKRVTAVKPERPSLKLGNPTHPCSRVRRSKRVYLF